MVERLGGMKKWGGGRVRIRVRSLGGKEIRERERETRVRVLDIGRCLCK